MLVCWSLLELGNSMGVDNATEAAHLLQEVVDESQDNDSMSLYRALALTSLGSLPTVSGTSIDSCA